MGGSTPVAPRRQHRLTTVNHHTCREADASWHSSATGIGTAPGSGLVALYDARPLRLATGLVRFGGPGGLLCAGSVARVVRGRIALVANRWLADSYPQLGTPTGDGTYAIDFTPFGFEPRNAGEMPTAVAGWLATDKDSIEIILASAQDRAVVTMRGKFANDSITGARDVSIARVTGGGGRFLMSRVRGR